MKAGRTSLLVAAIGVAAVVGYFEIDQLRGKRLVSELCARDGGLKVYETVEAKGYLDETIANPMYCYECFRRLISHQFEYVDVRVPADPTTAAPQAIQPGYYRFSLASRGDARCERWSKNVNLAEWNKQLLSEGMPPAQCVAVDELPSRPSEAVLTKSYTPYPNGESPFIAVSDITISESFPGNLIAHLRNYYFFNKWGRLFSWAPSQASASCGISLDTHMRILELEPISHPVK